MVEPGAQGADFPDSRTALRSLLESHGLRPSRALGQNFLVEPALADRIARLSGASASTAVLEIGAGLGALTVALARHAAHVVAVEVDRGLLPLLEGRAGSLGVEVVAADAMRADLAGIVAESDARLGGVEWSVVANLPYNVATPLILRLLEELPLAKTMLVMVQSEVADRLAAGVGSPAYGAVSVRVSYFAKASVLAKVPPQVFLPRPRVSSALLKLQRREPPGCRGVPQGAFPGTEYPRLVELVRAGFGQRRKTLRRSLSKVASAAALESCGIDPGQRAEELDLDQWCALACHEELA